MRNIAGPLFYVTDHLLNYIRDDTIAIALKGLTSYLAVSMQPAIPIPLYRYSQIILSACGQPAIPIPLYRFSPIVLSPPFV